MAQNKEQAFGLPQALGDGLVLRWATKADIENLAEFNLRIHSDDPNEPETFLTHWTRELMHGNHPTTRAEDFTLVVDENAGGKIVSTMNLISQTWAYDGVEFRFGRPELVGTDEAYRRRGLVRAQFDVIHAKSAARREMVQGITGIPWYYRQFGYEMGLDLGGSRRMYLTSVQPLKEGEELYRLRLATEADIPVLQQLYEIFHAGSLMTRVRSQAEWHYEMFVAHRESPWGRNMYLVMDTAEKPVGYAEYGTYKKWFYVREIAVFPGHSLRAVGQFLARHLQQEADRLNPERKTPLTHINFELGAEHPFYKALQPELEKLNQPYAWFVRVPDLPIFLQHIAPVLEQRLADSVMAGHSGETKLSFYRSQLKLHWQDGKLIDVAPYTPDSFFDCDAFFPDLTFLQLLFGYRSREELRQARADCHARNGDTAVLLDVLFPKRPSWAIALS